MLKKNYFSKLLNAASVMALSGILITSSLTSTRAMDDEENKALLLKAPPPFAGQMRTAQFVLHEDIGICILSLCPFPELLRNIVSLSKANTLWFRQHITTTEVQLELPSVPLNGVYDEQARKAACSKDAVFKFTYKNKFYTSHRNEKNLDLLQSITAPLTISGIYADINVTRIAPLPDLLSKNTALNTLSLKGGELKRHERLPICTRYSAAEAIRAPDYIITTVRNGFLAKLFSHNSVLTSLNLEELNYDFPFDSLIKTQISSNPSLKTLKFRHFPHSMAQTLGESTSLQNLSLTVYDGQIPTEKALEILLSKNSHLQELTLSVASDVNSDAVFRALRSNATLRKLKLNPCCLKTGDIDYNTHIPMYLIQVNTTSPWLDLSTLHYYDDKELTEALEKNTSLTRLDLRKTSRMESIITALGNSFKSNTTLRTLNIFNVPKKRKEELQLSLETNLLSERVKLHTSSQE